MLFQATTPPPLVSGCVGWRWVKRGFLWLSVRAKAHLKVLLLFLLAFEADRDLLDPGVLRKRLLVFRSRLLDLGDTLLQLLILCIGRANAYCTGFFCDRPAPRPRPEFQGAFESLRQLRQLRKLRGKLHRSFPHPDH